MSVEGSTAITDGFKLTYDKSATVFADDIRTHTVSYTVALQAFPSIPPIAGTFTVEIIDLCASASVVAQDITLSSVSWQIDTTLSTSAPAFQDSESIARD